MTEPTTSRIATPALLRALPSFRFARQGMLALGLKVAAAGSAFVLQVYLARTLGRVGFGEYSYVFAYLQLMLICAQGGFSMAALRYVSEYRTCGQLARLRGFLRYSSKTVLLASVVLALSVAGCATMLNYSGSAGSWWNILIVCATLPILSQSGLSSSVVRGLGHALPSMALGLIQPLLFLVALLVVAYLFPYDISPSVALLLNLGTAIFFLGIIYAMQVRLERQLGLGSEHESCAKEWLGTATPMMLIAGLVYLQGRTGVIVSGLLLDAPTAGTYAAVERLADVALLGLLSVNYLIAPKFSAIHSQGRLPELQRYARLAALGSTAVMLLITLPLVVFGKQVLRLFGEEYVVGYPVLLLLLGGVAVNALCGSAGILLQMTGHHRRLLGILVVGLVVNVALSLLLVPRFGIIGVAWANAVAIVCWNLSTVYTVRVHLGIWPHVGRIASNGII